MASRVALGGSLLQISRASQPLRASIPISLARRRDECRVVVSHYTHRAFDEPDSSYAALVGYLAELTRIRDTLQRMEDQYRRADHGAADQYRRA